MKFPPWPLGGAVLCYIRPALHLFEVFPSFRRNVWVCVWCKLPWRDRGVVRLRSGDVVFTDLCLHLLHHLLYRAQSAPSPQVHALYLSFCISRTLWWSVRMDRSCSSTQVCLCSSCLSETTSEGLRTIHAAGKLLFRLYCEEKKRPAGKWLTHFSKCPNFWPTNSSFLESRCLFCCLSFKINVELCFELMCICFISTLWMKLLTNKIQQNKTITSVIVHFYYSSTFSAIICQRLFRASLFFKHIKNYVK